MVPDQCCEKIDCIYSYMGLNHGTLSKYQKHLMSKYQKPYQEYLHTKNLMPKYQKPYQKPNV